MSTIYQVTCQLDDLTFVVSTHHYQFSPDAEMYVYADIDAPFGGRIGYQGHTNHSIVNAIKDGKISLKFVNEPTADGPEENIGLGCDLSLTYTYTLDGKQVTESVELHASYDNNGKNLVEYRKYLAMLKELTALRVEVNALRVENNDLKVENESLMSQI